MKNEGMSLNVRLMAILLVIALVGCVAIFFIHRIQLKRQAVFFLDEARSGAEDLAEEKDPLAKWEKFRTVSSKYRRYLAQQKEDLEVEQEVALLAYDTAQSLIEDASEESDPDKRRKIQRLASSLYGAAISSLEEVLRKNTDQPELRAKLVDILYKSGNWTGTIEHIKFLCQTPGNTVELAKLFDRFDLWKRITPPLAVDADQTAALDRFASDFDKQIDREKLLAFLGADLWMILEDPELLSTYAGCQAAREKYSVAEKSLEKAISLSPENVKFYETLAAILTVMKPPRLADADYWMDEMVEVNPNSYDARLKRGRYWNRVVRNRDADRQEQLRQKSLHDAVSAIQKAITIIADEADRQSPRLPETKALKAAFEYLPDKAPSMREPISPDYRQALLAANEAALALKGKLEGISDELDACRDGMFLAAQTEWLADWLTKERATDNGEGHKAETLSDAKVYAENLVSLYPAFSAGYSMLSEIEIQAGDHDEAIATLREGGRRADDSAGLLWRLAYLLIDSGRIEEAQEVCDKLGKEDAAQFIVDHLRARIDYAEGRWLEAAEGLEAVRDEVASRWPSRVKQMDFLLAECYGRLGRIDQQRDAYFRAASSDRTWLPALIGIAETKAKSGQIDDAIEDYRLIMKLHKAPESVPYKLAKLLIEKNLRKPKTERNWLEVSQIIDSLEKAEAEPLKIAFLKADLSYAQGNDDKASEILAEVQEKLELENSFLKKQLQREQNDAELLSGKDKEAALARADQLQLKIRRNAANQAAAWTAIVNVAKRKKDWRTAEKALFAAREKVGDTVSMRLTQGEHLLNRIGEKAAEPLRSLAGNTKHFSKAAQVRLWQGLAKLSMQAGDREQAKLLSSFVLRDEPGNRTMQIIRFEIAAQEKDFGTMESILDDIAKSEKEPGAFWNYGQAMILNMSAGDGDTKLLNKAQAKVAEALRIRPNWAAARLLSATLNDRQGNKEAAIEDYRKAIDLGAQSSAIIRRTVQLLASMDRFREADEVLRLLGDRQESLDGQTDFESSIIKAQIGKFDAAVAFAKKAAENSEKANDHVWLGQLLMIVGRQSQNQNRPQEAEKDLAEAEKSFEKAVELEPASDLAWVSLIQFYGQTGQIEKAETAIKKALDKLPQQKAAVAISQCYEAIGNNERAEEALLQSLAKLPRDAVAIARLADYYIRNKQNKKAVEQLKKIIDGTARADIEQKTKAKRLYATLLFQEGGEKNRKEALALIESNLRLNAASEADQYAKAVLLANDLSVTQRKKAIPVLEKLLDAQHSPSAEIQFTLAKLYLQEDLMTKFKNLMRTILRDEAKEPRYLSFYVDTLINSNELKEAGIYLEILKKHHPDSLNTKKLEARFAFEQKNYETAIRVFKDFLESSQNDGPEKMLNMAESAITLSVFAKKLREKGPGYSAIAKGVDDEAENIFQKFVDMQNGRELLMAQFLSRQGRLKKALKVAEKHLDGSSAEDIAKTCFVFLQDTSPTAEQLRQVDQILKTTLKKYPAGPQAIILKTALAILRDFQNRPDETEALYREILKDKPNDATAMNNLALFLALQGRELDEAEELVETAIKNNGRLPGLLDTRAIVNLAKNKPKKALDDLSLAIKKQPTAVRYFHQAQAYHQDGQKNAAIKSFDTAHEMGLSENSLIGAERRNYRKLQRLLR